MHGSVAEAVLAQAPVPVLLLHARPGEAVSPPFDLPSARILVPLDGRGDRYGRFGAARAMLGIAGELVLLTVVEPPERVRCVLQPACQRITPVRLSRHRLPWTVATRPAVYPL